MATRHSYRTVWNLALFSTLALAATAPLSAEITSYVNDEAGYGDAVTGLCQTMISFSDLDEGEIILDQYELQNVRFLTQPGFEITAESNLCGQSNYSSPFSAAVGWSTQDLSDFTIQFLEPVSAAALVVIDLDAAADVFVYDCEGTELAYFEAPSMSPHGFLGIVSDSADICEIYVRSTIANECIGLDDVRFTCELRGDIDGDCDVDLSDLAALLANYGRMCTGDAGDIWSFNPQTGHRYRLTSGRMNWGDAEAEAVSEGGHLVTINDAAENQWLLDTFGSEDMGGTDGHKFWIGFNDVASEGDWVWSNGAPVTYTNWFSGEPSAGEPTEDYGHMYNYLVGQYGSARTPGTWNDETDPTPPFGGIIERP